MHFIRKWRFDLIMCLVTRLARQVFAELIAAVFKEAQQASQAGHGVMFGAFGKPSPSFFTAIRVRFPVQVLLQLPHST